MQSKTMTSTNNTIFSTELDLRISDINYGNHLGHDSLISLIHEARVRFFKHYGYTEINICGLGILITNLNASYLAETFYPDTLVINISIGEKGRTSMKLLYQVESKNQEIVIAEASTTMVFYDYNKRKASRIPEEFLLKLKI